MINIPPLHADTGLESLASFERRRLLASFHRRTALCG